MRSAGPIFSEAHRVAAPFADLARADGPFVSMYLDTSPDVELAPQAIEKRWKNARRTLVDHRVPEDVIEAIGMHIDGAEMRGRSLAVVASFNEVLHVDHHDEPPDYEMIAVGSLPRLGPLLRWRQAVIPHVIVVADRTGADLKAWLGDGGVDTLTVEAMDVKAVTKVQPGGWSQPRYQRRVENAWEASAAEVADVVTRMAEDVRARLIAVAGDVRAVELLCKELPSRVMRSVQIVDGSRAADGDRDSPDREAKKLVATCAASDTVEVLQKFREELGQSDRATDGAEATIEALERAQVETLLVHDDPRDEREAWFGPRAEQVAMDADTVMAMGVDGPRPGRLVDVAIRAALGTGAGVWIVPAAGGPTGGVGAILRWS